MSGFKKAMTIMVSTVLAILWLRILVLGIKSFIVHKILMPITDTYWACEKYADEMFEPKLTVTPPSKMETIIEMMPEMEWVINPYYLIAVAAAVVVLVIVVLKRGVARQVRRLRGIKGECAQPGSTFTPGEIPSCQVEVYRVGLFMDTFVGYGVRLDSLLVVPAHVARAAAPEMAIGNKGNKHMIVNPAILSDVFADLQYYPVSTNVWSQLGVAQARPVKDFSSAQVQCVGRPGASSGYLEPIGNIGMMKYTGSTLPGMSGAAYIKGRQWYGIHIGVVDVVSNVGYSSALIAQDAKGKNLMTGETVPSETEMDNIDEDTSQKSWAREAPEKIYSHVKRAEPVDTSKFKMPLWMDSEECAAGPSIESAGIKQIATGFSKLPASAKEAVLAALKAQIEIERTVMCEGQSDEPVEVVVSTTKTYNDMRFTAMETRLDLLEKRVTVLEKPKEKKQKPQEVTPIRQGPEEEEIEEPQTIAEPMVGKLTGESVKPQCIKCMKQFNTHGALIAHLRALNHFVRGETLSPEEKSRKAYQDDNIPTVRTNGPFLGQRQRSQPWKTQNSRSASKSPERTDRFELMLESQLKIQTLMEAMFRGLEMQQRNTPGPSSATMRK